MPRASFQAAALYVDVRTHAVPDVQDYLGRSATEMTGASTRGFFTFQPHGTYALAFPQKGTPQRHDAKSMTIEVNMIIHSSLLRCCGAADPAREGEREVFLARILEQQLRSCTLDRSWSARPQKQCPCMDWSRSFDSACTVGAVGHFCGLRALSTTWSWA